MRHIAENLEPDQLDHPDSIRAALCEAVELCIPVAPPIRAVAGTRRVIALVGPTGVGKTTTVAKLAANFKLAHGVRVGLITVDTYRIAAVEQLKTYAEIIDLPLAVVNDPARCRGRLTSWARSTLSSSTPPGRSPRDEVKIRELAEFLLQARPDEVHLVLSAVAGQRSLRSAVERFAVVQVDRLILTKLDEADSLGGVLAVLGLSSRPLSYLTTGQAVPDDIEPADRKRLARLILRQEDLFVDAARETRESIFTALAVDHGPLFLRRSGRKTECPTRLTGSGSSWGRDGPRRRFTAVAGRERAARRERPGIGVAADDAIPALHQRQRGCRDVEPRPEPGDRAGGNGPARRGG